MTIIDEIRIHPEEGAKRLESECKPGLLALARRLCSDEGDAEELVNRTLAEAVANIDSLISRPALFGWMCQILVDCHAKDNRRKSRSVEAADSEAVENAMDEDAEARLFREVDAGILRDAIDTLPADIRKTVVMHYFMDVPVREAAKVLAVPTGTIAWRLHYARMLLAAKLGAVAKKPGGKALLIILALAALAAVGAAVMTAVGDARNTPPALSEGTPLSEGGYGAQDSSPLREGAVAEGDWGSTASGNRQSATDTSTPPLTHSSTPPLSPTTLGENMNKTTLRSLAAPIAALTVAATTMSTTSYGESVWKDAVLWMNGPVDLNGNGKWDGNLGYPVQVKCDGTSAASELPDARHGALAYSDSQVVSLATGNQTVYDNSGFQIRTNDVHFTAWGNKTAKWPCLYLPQASSGNPDAPYAQRMDLFADGGCPITGNNWSVLFRCRIENCFQYNWGGSWLLGIVTTDLGGPRELRIGFCQSGWTSDFTSPYYVGALIGGGAGNTAFTGIPAVKTNEWMEVALTVEGQKWRMTCATTNGVRWGQTFYVPGNHGSYSTNFIPATISLGGPRAYGVRNGSDNFRGDIQMFAMWNRTLSDREVLEAFGNGSPNTFRIGEEDCTAEMYGGAAPSAGDTVTLDPFASDKRPFPTTMTKGTAFRIPFSVDVYSAGRARWLRFSPQEGSAMGRIAVAMDGNVLGSFKALPRGTGAAARPSYFYIKPENFTQGDHVLTLTRTADGTGDVIFDVIELGGGWQVGLVDGNPYEIGRAGSGTPWYLETWNFNEYDYWSARTANSDTPLRIFWNMPKGAAEKFGMRMRYATCWVGNMPMTNSIVTYVNSIPVYTNSSVTWHTENHHIQSFDIPAERNAFKDGDNEITFEFSPCSRTDGDTDWVAYDMIGIEPLEPKLKRGFVIVVK